MPIPDEVREEVRASLIELRNDLIAVGRRFRVGLVDMVMEFCLLGKGEMVMALRQSTSSKTAGPAPPMMTKSAESFHRRKLHGVGSGSFTQSPMRRPNVTGMPVHGSGSLSDINAALVDESVGGGAGGSVGGSPLVSSSGTANARRVSVPSPSARAGGSRDASPVRIDIVDLPGANVPRPESNGGASTSTAGSDGAGAGAVGVPKNLMGMLGFTSTPLRASGGSAAGSTDRLSSPPGAAGAATDTSLVNFVIDESSASESSSRQSAAAAPAAVAAPVPAAVQENWRSRQVASQVAMERELGAGAGAGVMPPHILDLTSPSGSLIGSPSPRGGGNSASDQMSASARSAGTAGSSMIVCATPPGLPRYSTLARQSILDTQFQQQSAAPSPHPREDTQHGAVAAAGGIPPDMVGLDADPSARIPSAVGPQPTQKPVPGARAIKGRPSFGQYFEVLRDMHLREIIDQSVFGVELEMFSCKNTTELHLMTEAKAKDDFCPFLNNYLAEHNVTFQFYDCATAKSDRIYSRWKVTTDSSIQAEDGRPMFGFEIVSPKLSGWDDLRSLWHVADAARSYGCATNNTTALHVHVSCEHYSDVQVKQFLCWYTYFEAVIDQFHSFPRRDDSSQYCRSMVRSILKEEQPEGAGDAVDSMKALAKMQAYDVSFEQGFESMLSQFNPRLGNKSNSGRNHKINALLMRKTKRGDAGRRVEWRQHAGTCDSQEIIMWTKFCVLFTHTAATTPTSIPEVEATASALWELLHDNTLASYFTLKQSVLPPAPPGFVGVPREVVANAPAVRRTSRTGRTLMQAMMQQHFGLPVAQSAGLLM